MTKLRVLSPLPLSLVLLLSTVSATAAAQRPERLTDWTHPVFPVAEYVARRTAALAALGDSVVLLVPSAEGTSGGETFRQLDDFEYLAGLEVARSVLALDGRTRRSTLFVPRTDSRFENPGRPNDFPGRALLADPAVRALSGVDTVVVDDAFADYLRAIAARGSRVLVNAGRAGVLSELPPNSFAAPSPGDLLLAMIRRQHASLQVGNAYPLMATLRMIKSPREIAMLREAARATSIAIARGAARTRPGVDERALTGAFTADCLALGADRDAFSPIIKSGPNSLWPWRILGAHYDRRNRTLDAGDLVIFDVGCERRHYVSDVGRTFPVGGRFSARQRALVEMVRTISDAVIAAAKPGATLAGLQAVAQGAIPSAAKPYMQAPLFFGHHIGLSAGDPSLADVALAPGMVFTIEPWYYNHDEGVAVFVEDEVLITARGSENLTASLPRDADGLEALRNGQRAAMTAPDAWRTVTRDGVLSFTLDTAKGAVQVYDLLNGVVASEAPVCAHPVNGVLDTHDVSFVVQCAGLGAAVHVNTATYAAAPPSRVSPLLDGGARGVDRTGRKNEVVVVGMIHGEHRTSTRYGTAVLRRLLQTLKPDYVLTEISPNRLDAAMREYRSTGRIVEPRVVRFPEYVDVLFPLTRTMPFTVVPTAGWTRPMDAFRTAALRRIEADPSRRAEWTEYVRETRLADSLTKVAGADNPYFINSAAYDSLQTAAHEPYNRLFNHELGPGGWDNINRSHYGNIARVLDALSGRGKRVVITYGAGHREWLLRELRKRSDVTILEVAPFLQRIGVK